MNSFGRLFRVSIFGESHGSSVGIILDGVPAGIKLSKEDFYTDLQRRKPGSKGTTTRVEADEPLIESGLFNGYTTGSPLMIRFLNQNTKSKDYSIFKEMPRPSHADYVASNKYNGYEDYRGGGHFSGRLTTCLVAAGVVAKKIIDAKYETKIINLGGECDPTKFDFIISKVSEAGDSVGGIVEIKITNVPKFIGEPYFDSVESVISHALFSVGAVKGVEFGLGFEGASLLGSEFNDTIINKDGVTKTNNNGGINGGITNGNDIIIKVFVKPTPSIFKAQETYNFNTNKLDVLQIEGRHDAAIILRAMVVLEAMCAISLADLYLVGKAYK